MISIDTREPHRQIVSFVKNWVKLLADGEMNAACAQLDEPNSYGRVWTAELIEETIAETFPRCTIFRKAHPEGPIFTDPFELIDGMHHDVIVLDAGGYAFDYDIPLNGEPSDLTAQFEFLPRGGEYAVVLQDLHVL